jgi:hypothetical protein
MMSGDPMQRIILDLDATDGPIVGDRQALSAN